MKPKGILIIGGGFGGINAAKHLVDCDNVNITIVDRRNHHLFQPLLYQVATAGLSPADVASPIRSLFAGKENVRVVLDEIQEIQTGMALSTTTQYPFDYLILASGASHSYFGHGDWESFAPGLKTLSDATEIRRRILLAFELAEKERDSEKQRMLLTFVIVGGGPTGVELAGAIGEISRYTLAEDFRQIDPTHTRILLIEAGERILSSFDESLSKKAAKDLEGLGVQIRTSSRVTDIGDGFVVLDKEKIQAKTVLWAAGVKPSFLAAKVSGHLDKLGRVIVNLDLTIQEAKNIFVTGDLACFIPAGETTPLPGLAPVAIQQGRHAAKNIKRSLKNEPLLPFHYFDKGSLATIGRKKAVGQYAGWKFSGFLAWIIWIFVHIYFLIGFKNKLFVFMQWTWSYMTFKKGARLISEEPHAKA